MIGNMGISLANEEDIPQLVPLVNVAYRGLEFDGSSSDQDKSWTNELGVVEGPRVNPQDPEELKNKENVNVLKYEEEGQILGCIRLQKDQDICYIGTLSVHPLHQNKKIGSKLLDFSEKWALNTLKCTTVEMSVVSIRETLLQYYLRRGYVEKNERRPFPLQGCGVPKIPLDLIILEKTLV